MSRKETWSNEHSDNNRAYHNDGSEGSKERLYTSFHPNDKDDNSYPVMHTHYSDGSDKLVIDKGDHVEVSWRNSKFYNTKK
jgi:hypothetical protein